MARARIEGANARCVTLEGREYLSFAGCDYLGLAHADEVREALVRALERYGLSASASRATSGTTEEHEALEGELAHWLEVEAVAVTSSGYAADLAAIEVLARDASRARADAQSHAALFDALRAAGLAHTTYAFADARDAARELDGATALVTDGVFPAHATIAPLAELVRSARELGARLLVDDAHGVGVLGSRGRGSLEACALRARDATFVVGSLSKAFGAGGGFAAGESAAIAKLRSSRAYVGSTPIAAPLAAAARAALRSIAGGGPLAKLRSRIARAQSALARTRWASALQHSIPVLALDIGEPATRELERELRAAGIFVPWVHYLDDRPSPYLRAVLRAAHTDEDVDRLTSVLVNSQHAERAPSL